jgi:hypothetical protein
VPPSSSPSLRFCPCTWVSMASVMDRSAPRTSSGGAASWCLEWGIAQPLPPPAARIATRQRKEMECLLVVPAAVDSVVKRGV